VVLFTTATCPFCKQAKALLDSVGATYKEVYTHLPKGAMSFFCPYSKSLLWFLLYERRASSKLLCSHDIPTHNGWLLLKVQVDKDPDGLSIKAELKKRTGRTSVPSVWIRGQFVSACTQLVLLSPKR
jgi:glutaredoxin